MWFTATVKKRIKEGGVKKMKAINIKALTFLVILLTALIFSGCKAEPTPYEINNAESYTVSIRYDANGGIFTTNTSSIVDSYNLSELPVNSNGKAEIALLSPDNAARGNDAFSAVNNGYFLAGWYSERIETTGADGNTVYSYANKWDFENGLLEVDKSKQYSSENPVLTLYAAWVPLFEIEFITLGGEVLGSYRFDPTVETEFKLPEWSEESGKMEMYKFPEKKGYTFDKAYLKATDKEPIKADTIVHHGEIDYSNATAKNPNMKIYIEWLEGEWYHIYNAEQLIDNASLAGNYEICADLDFEGEIWPTAFMYGNFEGSIKGNGHTFKNIDIVQTNNSKVNAGLFGNITENASVSDITFENLSFTIKAGTRVVGTSYGVFAGTLSNDAQLSGIKITGSTLKIDSSCYFGADEYSIGLVCGMGNSDSVDSYEISCVAVGDEPEKLIISVDGNEVTVEFKE